jgi:threonine synthase
VYEQSQRVIEHHGAAAVDVARRRRNSDNIPTICVATASPVKFEDSVEEALGFVPERPARFIDLESRVDTDSGFVELTSIKAIKQYIRDNRQN